MKIQRILFLINPKSRRGRELGPNLRTQLLESGFEIVNDRDYRCDEFSSAIESHAGKIDFVAVAGGDGSMNAALKGLLKTNVPLAVIPLGTSNNLARNIGVALDPEAAIRALSEGHPKEIDLGTVNGIPFFIVAGMGISTKVNREVPPELKRQWGMLAYVITAFKTYKRYRPFRAEITTEGTGDLCVRSLQISVCNGQFFGSGLTVAEDATIQDGKFHLCSVQVEKWTEIPRAILGMKTGRHDGKVATLLLESADFRIKTNHRMKIDVDGEIMTETPAHFRVLPKAVRVIAPQPAS